MTSKYLLNSLNGAVNDHLTGLALSNNSVILIEDVNAIVRKDFGQLSADRKVFIISGGGAGHEPMFAGFVGKGLLSAAISGQFFASPSMGQIVKTIETICTKEDQILFIVANYTGDRLNFGLARETLNQNGFKNISMFCFGDDISQTLSINQPTKKNLKHRRGLAGIDFIIKIAGQASEDGKSLSEIIEHVKNESAKICTISVSLTACQIPGVGESFHLEDSEMELGLGIHGEPGIERVRVMTTKNTVSMMIQAILRYYEINSFQDSTSNFELSILVNNLGSMTQMELNVITKEIILLLQDKNVSLRSIEVRPVMTAFNMKGFSISSYSGCQIRCLPEYKNNSEFFIFSKEQQFQENSDEIAMLNRIIDQSMLIELLRSAAHSLIENSEKLNCCDSAGGDSDCGSTMERLARIILEHIDESKDVAFSGLARAISNNIGGTSGAIYGLLFFFAADFIVHHSSRFVGIRFWYELLKFATQKLSEYSGAQKDDRTMIDALWALQNELEFLWNSEKSLNREILHELKSKMILANERIAKLAPRAGRSANVDHERVKSQYDPGCFAVIVWCNAIIDSLLNTTKH